MVRTQKTKVKAEVLHRVAFGELLYLGDLSRFAPKLKEALSFWEKQDGILLNARVLPLGGGGKLLERPKSIKAPAISGGV